MSSKTLFFCAMQVLGHGQAYTHGLRHGVDTEVEDWYERLLESIGKGMSPPCAPDRFVLLNLNILGNTASDPDATLPTQDATGEWS